MKKFYYTFLLTQLFLPVCTVLGYLLHRPFALSMPELTVTLLGILTVYITTKLRKLTPWNGLILCLPLTIFNAVFLLFHGIMGGIAAFLSVVCGWILMHRALHRWYWWLCYGLSALACAGLALILPVWGFVQAMRTDNIVSTYSSPNGTYTAVLTISDQGALGGETIVTVRNEEKSIHIPLGCFEDSVELWRSGFLYAQDMEIEWESEDILNINGISYTISGENVPLLADVSRNLQISVTRGGVLRSWETHGGFHGDGETYTELYGRIIIPDSEFWHILPAPEEFWHLAANCRDDNDQPVIPEITEGFWYFQNRHPNNNDPTAIKNYGSWNYTLAVYDSVNQILYYYELDT